MQLERIDQAAKKKAAKGRRSSEKVVRPRKSPVMKSEAYGGASPSGEAHLGDTPLLNSLRSLKAEGENLLQAHVNPILCAQSTGTAVPSGRYMPALAEGREPQEAP